MKLLASGLFALAAGLAAAQEQAPALPDYHPGRYLLQGLLSLLFVIALIYGAFYLLRRLQGPVLRLGQEGPAEVVQSVPLSSGNVLHVVRVNGRLIGLASGPHGVTSVDLPPEAPEGGEGD